MLGVIQICHKGFDLASAGPDFTLDDLQQLEAGMLLYDAFYRWCRDATDEMHNWPTNRPKV